jgi:predicted nucleic acid-binding protein
LSRSERRGIITPAQGPIFLAGILANQPRLHPYVPLLWRAYGISSQARIGVYDCLYVALAEREGCQLLTADDRLVRTLQPTYPFVISLASLP